VPPFWLSLAAIPFGLFNRIENNRSLPESGVGINQVFPLLASR